MLNILGRSSSINVRKVLWTCSELDQPFEHESWGAGYQSTQSEDFLKLNPNAMVPVILDGDFVLWESNSIIRYLASSRFAEWLYPSAPRQRARIDQWIDWQASDLNKSWGYVFMALVRKSSTHQEPDQIEASTNAWCTCMAVLDQQLQHTGSFIAGDQFTLADIPIGLSVHRWFSTPLARPEFSAVAAYYDRLNDRIGYRMYGRNGAP